MTMTLKQINLVCNECPKSSVSIRFIFLKSILGHPMFFNLTQPYFFKRWPETIVFGSKKGYRQATSFFFAPKNIERQ